MCCRVLEATHQLRLSEQERQLAEQDDQPNVEEEEPDEDETVQVSKQTDLFLAAFYTELQTCLPICIVMVFMQKSVSSMNVCAYFSEYEHSIVSKEMEKNLAA